MTPEQRENWEKIKKYMEKHGKTDNDYYKRACLICKGSDDPHELPELL